MQAGFLKTGFRPVLMSSLQKFQRRTQHQCGTLLRDQSLFGQYQGLTSAPVLNKQGVSCDCPVKDLDLLWSQQFAEEFSNQVLPLTAEQLQVCIADRRQATQALDSLVGMPQIAQSDLPATVYQWMDLSAVTLAEGAEGQSSW